MRREVKATAISRAGGEIVYIGWGGWTVVSSRESSGKRAEAARYQTVRAS